MVATKINNPHPNTTTSNLHNPTSVTVSSNGALSKKHPSNDNEVSILDINNEFLQESSFSETLEDAIMDVRNSNSPPSNAIARNPSNSTSTTATNNDVLPEYDPRNCPEIIDLAVEDCENEKDEDLITNLGMYITSSKVICPNSYTDSIWSGLDVLSKFNCWRHNYFT